MIKKPHPLRAIARIFPSPVKHQVARFACAVGTNLSRWIGNRLYDKIDFSRPVFILSSPRSGSSFLSDRMIERNHVWSHRREADAAWWSLFPYSDTQWDDAISLADFRKKTDSQTLKKKLLEDVVQSQGFTATNYWRSILRNRETRYLEKTIANAFHLEVINHVFPDAIYIHLIRDPRETVSSMIEGWESGRFSKRRLPDDVETSLPWWCFPYPPGWEAQLGNSLEEVCAWSWVQHNRFITDSLDRLNLTEATLTLRYQDLLADLEGTLSLIDQHTGLKTKKRIAAEDQLKQPSWSVVSAPKKDKWKEINYDRILSVESIFQETEALLTQRACPKGWNQGLGE